ncbi:hypothetical protein M406DRAFT_69378 [Cryphonectria parasitica EP155]|uniref:Uncharacterized protein n=1 Tax=Cryphonectria parasitica (strain ATCC 38755 / EP155) TaxID=660469 RepID=A0A9P4Y664_CRYP1|nr:uncharacterized protein M406DRAFT_69378 [Cryphonectria parasitica EP155]KAF3767216.1 hypothetical protein M406DRAFT_69378 [Cryphonectria parasitica EP155]
MKGPLLLPSLLLTVFTAADALIFPQEAYHVQAPLSDTVPFTLRDAHIDDVDEFNVVNYEAFIRSEAWQYIYQFADEVGSEYTLACQRQFVEKLIRDDTKRYKLRVLTVPDSSSDRGERVVSISGWDYGKTGTPDQPSLSSSSLMMSEGAFLLRGGDFESGTTFNCSAHLDVNTTREADYVNKINSAVRKNIVEPFSQYLYLGLLATHPDWDGNGFAAEHLHWGKAEVAKLNHEGEGGDKRMPIMLLGTPAGYPLYVSEGFEGLKNVTIERLDGKDPLWYEVMKLDEAE